MGKALYRKYRPISLDTVVGQDSVIKPLSQAIKSGTFSHAYIFTGPRGCGKTSVARIFAHEINGFKYELEDSYVDIIEIDGASNNGVDNIRDLREKAMIAPTEGKYKIYIIDEVHMLSTQAFNALLKVLEEPPKHVVFILATTNLEKVPITITSRAQIFNFNLADEKTMKDYLSKVAKDEKIKISSDALDIVVRRGGGSFRDSISLLDQISSLSDGKTEISPDDINRALGLPNDEKIKKLLKAFEEGEETTDILKELLNTGTSAETIAANIIEKIIENPTAKTLDLVARLFEVSYPFAEAKLLVAFLESKKIVLPRTETKTISEPKKAEPKKPDFVVKREKTAETVRNIREELAKKVESAKKNEVKPEDFKKEEVHEAISLSDSVIQDGKLNIEAFLADVRRKSSTVFSYLEKASYVMEEDNLDIYIEKRGSFSIVSSNRNLEILNKAAPKYRVRIHCLEDEKMPKNATSFSSGKKVDGKTQEKIEQVSAIIGKGVVADSDDPF